jgi:hypothetical protein
LVGSAMILALSGSFSPNYASFFKFSNAATGGYDAPVYPISDGKIGGNF